jgi:hypothetical protein
MQVYGLFKIKNRTYIDLNQIFVVAMSNVLSLVRQLLLIPPS